MHLQANGFKGLKNTFTNNGFRKIIKRSFTFIFHFIMENRFKGFRFKLKVQIFILHKQTK